MWASPQNRKRCDSHTNSSQGSSCRNGADALVFHSWRFSYFYYTQSYGSKCSYYKLPVLQSCCSNEEQIHLLSRVLGRIASFPGPSFSNIVGGGAVNTLRRGQQVG